MVRPQEFLGRSVVVVDTDDCVTRTGDTADVQRVVVGGDADGDGRHRAFTPDDLGVSGFLAGIRNEAAFIHYPIIRVGLEGADVERSRSTGEQQTVGLTIVDEFRNVAVLDNVVSEVLGGLCLVEIVVDIERETQNRTGTERLFRRSVERESVQLRLDLDLQLVAVDRREQHHRLGERRRAQRTRRLPLDGIGRTLFQYGLVGVGEVDLGSTRNLLRAVGGRHLDRLHSLHRIGLVAREVEHEVAPRSQLPELEVHGNSTVVGGEVGRCLIRNLDVVVREGVSRRILRPRSDTHLGELFIGVLLVDRNRDLTAGNRRSDSRINGFHIVERIERSSRADRLELTDRRTGAGRENVIKNLIGFRVDDGELVVVRPVHHVVGTETGTRLDVVERSRDCGKRVLALGYRSVQALGILAATCAHHRERCKCVKQ